jgi:LysR family transcriptional regulator, transcriptional activator of the cysJI operon
VLFPELLVFKEIAAHRSISKGAEACGISQSAASQQMQELERKLGVELLDRSIRPLELTPAGRVYHRLCREALRLEEEFQVELQNLKGQVEGHVRVASIYSIGISELAHLQEDFLKRFPDAQVHVSYMRPDKIYDEVLEGRVDLGLVSYPAASREMAVIPWREEEMAVALYPSHPLAKRPWVRAADLRGEQFIGFDADLPISRETDRYFREQDVAVEIVMQFDNTQSIKEAVALRQGISLLPARTMQPEVARGSLASVPLRDPGMRRPVGILHLKRKRFHRAAQGFLGLLQERVEEAVR